MPGTTALLFQTHFFDAWCERAFRRLASACPPHFRPTVLIHLPPGAPLPERLAKVPHHVVRTPEMRVPAYGAKAHGEPWDLWRGGHTDLILLHYFRAQPDHDRYWIIEYDVRFSGDWARFLSAYEEDDTDLLAPGLIDREADPDWYNWPSIAGPRDLPAGQQLRAFMPVFRASAAMMRRMDTAYREGWCGHCEGTWPTLAREGGLSFADLGGDGPYTPERYRGRFYSSTPQAVFLAPGTLVFKPAMYRMGRRPDMLWHPVKPFFWRDEVKEGLRDIWRRAGMIVRAGITAAGLPLPAALRPGAWEAAQARRRAERAQGGPGPLTLAPAPAEPSAAARDAGPS
ncbi:hypothetical protein [Falsiroseomonas sp. CW058]|uniref:hypothetical protein n=1 Tax=Falsiroseomonas sp. CW058 TaxID=3388664 RepID=UPI003D3147E7